MKTNAPFTHINAQPKDLEGNNGIGRYILLPGSEGRAQEIAKHFDNLQTLEHPRGHHLYLGTLIAEGETIDVATIATGMGCPSMEIYLHELYHLGAKRFLRVGTAGSLQPWVKVGHLINVQASVRDESTSQRYIPVEFPAVASLEISSAILLAAEQLDFLDDLHTGIVHCKSSLYAREFSNGPLAEKNKQYMTHLTQAGVLASEMETSTLFVQTQIYNHEWQMKGDAGHNQVLAGAVLGVATSLEDEADMSHMSELDQNLIELGLETVRILALQELG